MKQRAAIADPNLIFISIEANMDGSSFSEKYLNKISTTTPRFKSPLSQSWSPPPQNCWKINTDASWSEEKGVGGLGWIVRDSNGSFIFAGFKKVKKKWPILCLELKAIEEGLRCLLDKFGNPLPKVVVESDSAEAVDILNHAVEIFSEDRSVANNVEAAAELFGEVAYCFSRRDSNLEAHFLARRAIAHKFVGGSYTGYLASSNSEENIFCMAIMPPG